jgi:hypothetical protein
MRLANWHHHIRLLYIRTTRSLPASEPVDRMTENCVEKQRRLTLEKIGVNKIKSSQTVRDFKTKTYGKN